MYKIEKYFNFLQTAQNAEKGEKNRNGRCGIKKRRNYCSALMGS